MLLCFKYLVKLLKTSDPEKYANDIHLKETSDPSLDAQMVNSFNIYHINIITNQYDLVTLEK